MIETLLIGSGNPTKIGIYKDYFSDLPVKLVSTKDLSLTEEPEEDRATLEENAILKAKFYFERSGLPTLADDAGFEIPALNNFPGVYSRRFAGPEATDNQIIDAIIEKMKDLKGDERKARMRVAVAFTLDGKQVHVGTGEITGHVPEVPYEKRTAHMPYRSLLFVDSVNKWFDDLLGEDGIGYRKKAVEELKKYLTNN